ncbi:MAG: hypothetical protein AB7O38_21180, partial [Pirellulaceae bacterium]
MDTVEHSQADSPRLPPAGRLIIDAPHPRSVTSYPAPWRAPRPAEPDMLSPRFLIRVFCQWWYVLLPAAGVLGSLGALIVFLTFTPVFRATAQVQIARSTPYLAYERREPVGDPEEFVETQIELMTSDMVLGPVLQAKVIANMPEIQAQNNAADWVKGQVRVARVGRSELYDVSFDGPNPANAAEIVNAIIAAYFEVRRHSDEQATQRMIDLLRDEHQSRQQTIKNLQEKMRGYYEGIADALPPAMVALRPGDERGEHPLAPLHDQLLEAEVQVSLLEVQLQALNQDVAGDVDVPLAHAEIELAINEDEEVAQLRSLIKQKKLLATRQETASALGVNDPGYRRIQSEIAGYERKLQSIENSARP